ncbi:hypothetical protein NBRC116587_10690 [Pseudoteredinibacter isoporae]
MDLVTIDRAETAVRNGKPDSALICGSAVIAGSRQGNTFYFQSYTAVVVVAIVTIAAAARDENVVTILAASSDINGVGRRCACLSICKGIYRTADAGYTQ